MLCSSEADFETQATDMEQDFLNMEYPFEVIEAAKMRARNKPRSEIIKTKTRKASNSHERPILALTYHSHNLPIRKIILDNFSIIKEDPDLSAIFPHPPLTAFRKDRTLRDHLVRAKFNTTTSNINGNSPCNQKQCKTCPYIHNPPKIEGPCGQFYIRSSLNCQSSNVVYAITCTLCGKIYIGETYRTLNERFAEHHMSIRLKYKYPVAVHFNSPNHNLSHLKICSLWKNSKGSTLRKFMESRIINSLGTTAPAGINIRQ